MEDLRLASLMCSKVCHDLISPVGALGNGLEVLEDDDDPDMRAMGMKLLRDSADKAAAKLKYARLAYGAGGSMGQEIDIAMAEEAIKELHEGGKVKINWIAPQATADKDVVKVLVSVAHLAFDCIPRGGDLIVKVDVQDGHGSVDVLAQGEKAKLGDDVRAGFSGEVAVDDLDSRTIVPHICSMLSKGFGNGITMHADDEAVKFSFTF